MGSGDGFLGEWLLFPYPLFVLLPYSKYAGEPAGLFTTPPPDKISKIYAHIHFVEGEGNAYFITFFDNVNLILSKIYHFSQYYSSVTMLVWVLRLCIITRIMRLPYRRTNFFG